MGNDFVIKLNIAVECPSLREERCRDGKKLAEVLVLDEKGASLRLSGGSLRRGRGPRLAFSERGIVGREI